VLGSTTLPEDQADLFLSVAHLVRQPIIGKLVDEALLAIERDNPSLKGVLPKDSAQARHAALPKLAEGWRMGGIDRTASPD